MEPKEIKLPFKIKRPVLALGAHTKNTVCFAQGQTACISPEHSNLGNLKDFRRFESSVKYFLKRKPAVIACDLHPEYQSTKFAFTLSTVNCELLTIQHHHAHIVSCMAENGLKNQKVIGIAFDGTGLGIDNTLWGAEALVCDYSGFKRMACLLQIPLLGSERAILEPYRLAIAWLYQIYGGNFFAFSPGFLKNLDKRKWQVLENMYLKKFNSPLSSSAGRLFDAVGSLVLEKPTARFEAELAIELEKLAASYNRKTTAYAFKITRNRGCHIIDPSLMFKEIIAGLKTKQPKEEIARRFHLTVAKMIAEVCLELRKETRINEVVLSGGCFQNKTLLSLALELLYNKNFNVLTHNVLPPSDFSISLGQAVAASCYREV